MRHTRTAGPWIISILLNDNTGASAPFFMKGNIEPEQLEQARIAVGAWLKEKRTGKSLSQSALARMMGIDQATINKIEVGKWAITVDMLALFCEHLESPITELFKLSDENDQLHTA